MQDLEYCGVLIKALDSHRIGSGFDPRSVLTSSVKLFCPYFNLCTLPSVLMGI